MSLKTGNGIKWPNDKNIALMVTFDLDAEWLRFSRGLRCPLSFADKSRGMYGIEEGLPRIHRVLDKHGVKSTFFIPGRVIKKYPDAVEKIAKKGHELAYHGWAHEESFTHTMTAEEQCMIKAEKAFVELTGRRPSGARGCFDVTYDFTPQLLRSRGYKYSSVMKDCDYAYLYPGEGEAPLVELPTDQSLDDYTYFFFTFNEPQHRSNYPVDYVFDYWKDAFDELAGEGDKIMVMKFHPQLIGRASRVLLLDRFLAYAGEHGAWTATCEEVADYVIEFEREGAVRDEGHEHHMA